MATLTPLKITESGVGSNINTAYAETGCDDFSNTGIEFLRIRNDYSAPYTVRVTAQTTSISHPTYGAVTKANTDVIVTNGTDAYIGPFKQGVWNDTNNKVQVTYRTGSVYATGSALSTIGVGSTHLLKVEILYLEN